MVNDSKIKLRNCVDNENDKNLLFEWSNDPVVRQNSLSTKQISYEEHSKWFNSKMNDKNYIILFLNIDDKDVGVARLQIFSDYALISYSISSLYRGKGYGTILIKTLEQYIIKNGITKLLMAEVKQNNVPSLNIFRKLGYCEERDNEIFIFKKEV